MERNKPIEIISIILSILTLVLMYRRFTFDQTHDKRQQRLLDLQVELHKEQIADLKSKYI